MVSGIGLFALYSLSERHNCTFTGDPLRLLCSSLRVRRSAREPLRSRLSFIFPEPLSGCPEFAEPLRATLLSLSLSLSLRLLFSFA